jgi:hypothetical protein
MSQTIQPPAPDHLVNPSQEARMHDAGLPMALTLAALILWGGFQTVQLWSERANLKSASANQAAQVEQSQKVRGAVDGFAADTARLAAAGNANAQFLVDELKKRGVTIDPAKQGEPAGATPAPR